METKFTPGPWFWDYRPKYHHCNLTSERGGHMIVMDFDRWGMQCAQPRLSNRNGDIRGGIMCGLKNIDIENHPDARLIAAAPDLYAACEAGYELSKYVAAINWDGTPNTQEWLDGLRERIEKYQELVNAALAKARGE